MGFDQMVTIGNKAVVGENEILQYWLDHPMAFPENDGTMSSLSPVGIYLESIENGRELLPLIKKMSQINPVFILKPGKSAEAARAMHSHTGSMAGEDSVLEEAIKEAGAIRCQELGDFFDLARAFAWENAPLGPRVAVVSNAGGPAVLSTDTIKSAGLELAQFSEQSKQKLKETLPRMASFLNPVDVMGDALADRFGEALEVVMNEPTVDAVLMILTPQLMTQIEKTAEIIGSFGRKYQKPIVCSFIGGGLTMVGEKVLDKLRIPSFPFPERAIKALAAMWKWQKRKMEVIEKEEIEDLSIDKVSVNKIIAEAKEANQPSLNNIQASKIMEILGVPVPATAMADSVEAAKEFCKAESGFPVVLKLSAPGLLHKTDIGGVITHINSEKHLKEAFLKLKEQNIPIQIQKQIDGGVEMILGIKRDPTFGEVMLFGAGGSLAELLNDRNIHLLPMTNVSVRELVRGSRIFPLLDGYRGNKPYDLEPVYKVMRLLAKLMEDVPEIAEIEINPLKITLNGAWALDPKVVLTTNLNVINKS